MTEARTMRTYLLRRLVHTVPVLLGVATVVFLALRLIPGDPAIALAGEKASVQEIARLREELGLNRAACRCSTSSSSRTSRPSSSATRSAPAATSRPSW